MQRKRFGIFLVAVFFLTIGFANGAEKGVHERRLSSQTPPDPFSTHEMIRNRNLILDFMYDTLAKPDVRFCDVRVSPVVRSEEWSEYPVELGFLVLSQEALPLILQKLHRFSTPNLRIGLKSLAVCCTAENNADGSPVLVVTLNCAAYMGSGSFHDSIKSRNEVLIKGITGLFQQLTFTPQVRKKLELTHEGDQKLRGRETWITNLRIDSDFRTQVTGYALEFKSATKLENSLEAAGILSESHLSQMNKNVYEKVPVYRFDLLGLF